VRHTPTANPDTYRQVRVKEKETSTVAWIRLPDHPYPPDPDRLDAPPPAGQTAQQPRQLPAAMPSLRATGPLPGTACGQEDPDRAGQRRRGTFASVKVLIGQIRDYIDHRNTNAKPFA
jgi:hypothetical protein